MSKKQLFYYLLEKNTTMPVEQIIISFCMCVLLSLFVYFIYKKTYTGVLYSKSFNLSILLISIITCMIMMIISSNLAVSLGMVGALSIIRFRAAIKDPKDIAYLFWAIGIGLSTGTGVYIIGVVGSIFISILLILMDKGLYDESCYLLVIRGENFDSDVVESELRKYTKRFKLRMKTITTHASEVTYELRVKHNHHDLIQSLQQINFIDSVNLVSYNGEIAG